MTHFFEKINENFLGCFAVIVLTLVSFSAQGHTFSEKIDTIDEVVITATNNAVSGKLLPYTVTSVSSKQIESTGHSQLLSALSGLVPSLFVTERNILGFGVSTGGSGGIKVRGVGGNPTSQVLMMIDGKPQYAGVFSHHVADNYQSDYVDHVEIVRGPSSVLYGSNAMGGAINVVTKVPREDGVKTSICSSYGSYNTWQNSIVNMVRKRKFSSIVSAEYDRTDGTEKNFDFRRANGYVKVGYDFSENWNLYGDYLITGFNGNDPIYARLEKGTDDIYHQEVLRGEASLVASNKYENTNGVIRLYYSHGNHKIEDPELFRMNDNRIGVLAYQNYHPWTQTDMTFGFDFDKYTGEIPMSGGLTHEQASAAKLPVTMERKEIVEYSPYLTISQGIWDNVFVVNGGLRMANSSMFGTHWIPQIGISANPGANWTIKANASNGYRNPSFKELYLYKMANPDLQPENMWNYEIGVKKRFPGIFSFEITSYLSRGSNIIQSEFSQELKHQVYVNTGEFVNKGVEFSAMINPLNTLVFYTTYSYLCSDIDNLTGAPKHQYSLSADWEVCPKVILDAELKGVNGLYVAEDVENQNYALLNFRCTYKVVKFLELFIQGYNLTNVDYCINKGYDMPGITVMGGFKTRF